MKLNNIKITDFRESENTLEIDFETFPNAEEINTNTIEIKTDSDDNVKTFYGYSLTKVEALEEKVVASFSLSIEDTTKETLSAMQEKLDESMEKNSMLEDCIIELATEIYGG